MKSGRSRLFPITLKCSIQKQCSAFTVVPGVAWKWRLLRAGQTGVCSEAYLQGWPLTNWRIIQWASMFIWVMWLCWKGLLFWESRIWVCTTRWGRCLSTQPPIKPCSRPQKSFPDCKSAPSCWGRNSTVTWRGPEGTALGFLVVWPVFPVLFARFASQSN